LLVFDFDSIAKSESFLVALLLSVPFAAISD
jgi:hypothetical protein